MPETPTRQRWMAWLTRAALGVALADLLLVGLLLWPDLVPDARRQPLRLAVALLTAALTVALLVLLRRLRAALAQAEAAAMTQRALVDAMPAALSLWSAEGRLLQFNAQFAALHARPGAPVVAGVDLRTLLQRSLADGDIPEAHGREAAWLDERLRAFAAPGPATIRRRADGSSRRLIERRLPDGSVLGHSIDITELDLARAAEARATARLRDAIEALPAGFELYDADDRLVLSNGVMKSLYPRVADMLDSHPTFEALVRANRARGGLSVADGEFESWLAERQRQRRAGGEPRVHELADGLWLRTYEHSTHEGGIVGVRIDVSELMLRDRELGRLNAELDGANAELRRQADTDALTAVANRRRFDRELGQSIASGAPLVLLLVDIDHFKRFNDHHGHPAGDACLRRVAAVLTAALRGPADLAARLGGEEFAVLLPGEDGGGGAAAAQRCLDLLADAAISHGDSPLGPHVTACIGIAAHPGGPADGAGLLAAADGALYEAKRGGRARWHLHG